MTLNRFLDLAITKTIYKAKLTRKKEKKSYPKSKANQKMYCKDQRVSIGETFSKPGRLKSQSKRDCLLLTKKS